MVYNRGLQTVSDGLIDMNGNSFLHDFLIDDIRKQHTSLRPAPSGRDCTPSIIRIMNYFLLYIILVTNKGMNIA